MLFPNSSQGQDQAQQENLMHLVIADEVADCVGVNAL